MIYLHERRGADRAIDAHVNAERENRGIGGDGGPPPS
jgi:hypothetical protein